MSDGLYPDWGDLEAHDYTGTEGDNDAELIGKYKCIYETAKAILVKNLFDEKEYWIPLSQITGYDYRYVRKLGDEGTVGLSFWFVEKNNIPHVRVYLDCYR